MRRLVAFLFHAPGLWLVYRERLPRRLYAANAVAIGVTLVAAAVAFVRLDGLAAAAAWASGHVLWGAVLAAKI